MLYTLETCLSKSIEIIWQFRRNKTIAKKDTSFKAI